jgi:peptidyl-prolyl cis-trans isomerase SurA
MAVVTGASAQDPAPNGSPAAQSDTARATGIQRTTFESATNAFPGVNDGRVAVQIRAHVNGVPILDEEVRCACFPFFVATMSLPEPERSRQQAEVFRRQIQLIIDREVLLQDAFARLQKNGPQFLDKLKEAASKDFDKKLRLMKRRSGAKTDDEFKETLRAQGISLEVMRRQMEREFMAHEYLSNRVYSAIERIGHQQILEYYANHPNEFEAQDRVTWQHLFIDGSKFPNRQAAKQFADELVRRAQGGEDFNRLLQYDNGDSSYRRGEGIGHQRGEIRPIEAEPVLFSLRDTEAAAVETSSGFHVMKLVKREYAGRMPLDEKLQKEIKRKLQNDAFERETKRLLTDLKSRCAIEIAAGP